MPRPALRALGADSRRLRADGIQGFVANANVITYPADEGNNPLAFLEKCDMSSSTPSDRSFLRRRRFRRHGQLAQNPVIKGFTTNPSLMRKAGITSYEEFARKALAAIRDRPISLEVFADDFDEMEQQAQKIASWGRNANVKIPITNTKSEFTGPLDSQVVCQRHCDQRDRNDDPGSGTPRR